MEIAGLRLGDELTAKPNNPKNSKGARYKSQYKRRSGGKEFGPFSLIIFLSLAIHGK